MELPQKTKETCKNSGVKMNISISSNRELPNYLEVRMVTSGSENFRLEFKRFEKVCSLSAESVRSFVRMRNSSRFAGFYYRPFNGYH